LGWSQSGDSIDQQLTIEVGDTVTWTWGSGTHNLEQIGDISEPGFAEGYFSSGHVYSHTFTTVGAHDYLCSPHPNTMYGTITVTE
jgi:plastocyanin